MFKISKNREFSHIVTVSIPVDGGHEEQTFTCRFRALPASEAEKHDLRTGEGTKALLKAAIVSFGDDLVGEDDKPVIFNNKLRDAMLDDYPIRQGLISTYLAAMTKARAGN